MTPVHSSTTSRLWSLAGIVAPMVAALLFVPLLIDRIGVNRFGVLSLCMAVIGYASVLDLGLARAVTRQIAESISRGETLEAQAHLRAAVGGVLIAGCGAAALMMVLAPGLAARIIRDDPRMVLEATQTLRLVGASLPLVLLSVLLAGALEGMQRFRRVNALRVPFGILSLLLPWVMTYWRADLTWVVLGLVLSRAGLLVALGLSVLDAWPGYWRGLRWDGVRLRELLRYGGWLTVSSVVGPVMDYLDRFWISVALGAVAVAYYTVPYDVLTRILLLPSAVCAVAFSQLVWARGQPIKATQDILGGTLRWSLWMVAPVCVVMMSVAPELLTLWLGPEFARHSVSVARWFVIGVLINASARTPHVHLLASGRSDWVAKLHLFELPLYLAGLWLAARAGSLELIACVWVLRIALDAVALHALSIRLDPRLRQTIIRPWRALGPLMLGLLVLGFWPLPLAVRVGLAALALVILGGVALRYRQRPPGAQAL